MKRCTSGIVKVVRIGVVVVGHDEDEDEDELLEWNMDGMSGGEAAYIVLVR